MLGSFKLVFILIMIDFVNCEDYKRKQKMEQLVKKEELKKIQEKEKSDFRPNYIK